MMTSLITITKMDFPFNSNVFMSANMYLNVHIHALTETINITFFFTTCQEVM